MVTHMKKDNVTNSGLVQKPFYTLGEELFNAISHGVGAVLSIGGCAVVILIAIFSGSVINVVSAAIYGATLIILYTMSTLYHSFTNRTVKKVFRVFDHCSIYLLIAGTYTPFTLVALKGVFGYTLFAVVWSIGILGIVLSAVNMEKFRVLLMICYIATGWIVVVAMKPLLEALDKGGVILLIVGGVLYTVGVIFYKLKKIKYMHSVWHLFVLGGSILHYFSIVLYVFPAVK